jgi:hypothetical protein
VPNQSRLAKRVLANRSVGPLIAAFKITHHWRCKKRAHREIRDFGKKETDLPDSALDSSNKYRLFCPRLKRRICVGNCQAS